ncbi:uncharacterized protein LOC126983990 [Eriocheir sinensis]|uniref:uncharacterized protein LOC126983990 n=1 Tax=Eriocheir sinensis TaxID=95602 RepID=UPI0021C69CAB|nr:uncharacterized protein LOC126983990 [Eriocheir sinensis]
MAVSVVVAGVHHNPIEKGGRRYNPQRGRARRRCGGLCAASRPHPATDQSLRRDYRRDKAPRHLRRRPLTGAVIAASILSSRAHTASDSTLAAMLLRTSGDQILLVRWPGKQAGGESREP